jgi:3-oxoacyl-[acyl-carrier protein] reductase
MRFTGKVAIVTGAGRGMGKAHAIRFASEGARVAVVDKSHETAVEVASRIGPPAIAIQVDVTAATETERMADVVTDTFGRIDILVNNAGGAVSRRSVLLEETEQNWQFLMDLNLKSQWLCAKAVVPAMKRVGAGKIVNITSVAGVSGTPGRAAYSSAKAGVIGLTRVMAREWGPDNINVNAVGPGLIRIVEGKTSSTEEEMALMSASILAEQHIKRIASPEDVSGLVLFLASEDADLITGQVVMVDGGASF